MPEVGVRKVEVTVVSTVGEVMETDSNNVVGHIELWRYIGNG